MALNVLSYFVHFSILLFVSYFAPTSGFFVIFQPTSKNCCIVCIPNIDLVACPCLSGNRSKSAVNGSFNEMKCVFIHEAWTLKVTAQETDFYALLLPPIGFVSRQIVQTVEQIVNLRTYENTNLECHCCSERITVEL